MVTTEKLSIFGLTPAELDSLCQNDLSMPKFAAGQIRDWIYQKLVSNPQEMTNLSKLQRQRLAEKIDFTSGRIEQHQRSADGTQKLLIRWDDAQVAETVLIPDDVRRTACISSQVGCPVGCKFCASGVNGSQGNLPAGRIVEQVYALNRELKSSGERITHIVLMGMGEPLANYNNVIKAIRILHDPDGFNISARKITLSTVGVPPRMRQLAEEDLPLNLAISLHAPTEGLRKQLIPWAEHFSLDDILDAARFYFDRTGREITLEYILLAGVNDRPEHARQLAAICHTLRANVNLIRYNEVAALPFSRPESQDVLNFQSILRHNGVNAHVRKSRGRDIDAACGQLRQHNELPMIQPTPG